MAATDSSSDDDYDRLPTEFHPNQKIVDRLVQALGAQPNERGEQPWARKTLDELSPKLDFNCHLAYIFISYSQGSFEARMQAGVLLKNNILRKNAIAHIPGYMQSYIKNQVLSCLGVVNPKIRSVVSAIISAFVGATGFDGWPRDLLGGLLTLLSSETVAKVQGSMGTLAMICEDHLDKFIDDRRKPLSRFVPKWIELMKHPDLTVSALALTCLDYLLDSFSPHLQANFAPFLSGLFHLAKVSRQEKSIRLARLVCQAFGNLIKCAADQMHKHIDSIVDYMLTAAASSDEDLALAACAFFPHLAQTELNLVAFSTTEKLKRLVMTLLRGIMFRDDNPMIEQAKEHSSKPDSRQDLAPQHPLTRGHYAQEEDSGDEDEEDELYGGDLDYDEEDGGESQLGETKWSLRSCSALTLDIMACTHGKNLLDVLLPLLGAATKPDANWKVIEASVVAIGAIANGCAKSMAPNLPKLHPWLVSLRKHPNPLVRVITAWTLSRLSNWIVDQTETDRYFRPTLLALLELLRDSSKLVQTAACFALRTLQPAAREMLIPYLPSLLQRYNGALLNFQAKNRLLMLTVIQRLCKAIGPPLGRYHALIMEPLIPLWKREVQVKDSYFVYPLMATFTEMASAIGPAFQPYAQPLFMHCLKAIDTALKPDKDDDSVDLAHAKIYSFDLIAAICEGLGPNFVGLLNDRVHILMPMVIKSMKDPVPQVRQAAFSLAGDLSRDCIQLMRKYMHAIVQALSKGIDPGEASGACNNAAWALSEIVMKVGREPMLEYTSDIVKRLVDVVNEDPENLPDGLVTNCALALGRFTLVLPDQVAPKIGVFIRRYLEVIKYAPNDAEKEQALKGLCLIVNTNPKPVQKFFPQLCEVLLSWRDSELNPDLRRQFINLLQRFKRAAGDGWDRYFNSRSFTSELRDELLSVLEFS